MSRLLCIELEPNNAEQGGHFPFLRSVQLQAAFFNLIAKSTQQTIKEQHKKEKKGNLV